MSSDSRFNGLKQRFTEIKDRAIHGGFADSSEAVPKDEKHWVFYLFCGRHYTDNVCFQKFYRISIAVIVLLLVVWFLWWWFFPPLICDREIPLNECGYLKDSSQGLIFCTHDHTPFIRPRIFQYSSTMVKTPLQLCGRQMELPLSNRVLINYYDPNGAYVPRCTLTEYQSVCLQKLSLETPHVYNCHQ